MVKVAFSTGLDTQGILRMISSTCLRRSYSRSAVTNAYLTFCTFSTGGLLIPLDGCWGCSTTTLGAGPLGIGWSYGLLALASSSKGKIHAKAAWQFRLGYSSMAGISWVTWSALASHRFHGLDFPCQVALICCWGHSDATLGVGRNGCLGQHLRVKLVGLLLKQRTLHGNFFPDRFLHVFNSSHDSVHGFFPWNLRRWIGSCEGSASLVSAMLRDKLVKIDRIAYWLSTPW